MKNKMEDIDALIKETLTKEEAKFYNELEEQNLFGMIKGLFKGKDLWFVILMNLFNIAVFGVLIYCIIQTFDTDNTNDLILWVGAILMCFITMSIIKLHAWMHMHRNVVLREIKRLELQVSSLAGKVSE